VTGASCVTPLRFEPILKEKIWGGTALKRVLGKAVPSRTTIGESWELSGVAGNESVSISDPCRGATLGEIVASDPGAIVGGIPRYRGFPLLYKFIDAHAKLSVQVHPDDAQAKALGYGEFGKSECWYIMDAKPGAQVVCGFAHGVSRDAVRDAAASEKILPLLNYIPVSPGDVIFVPGRTVHAVLGGVLLYEVQETADTTFRLFDWDRLDKRGNPRPLHIHESLEILDTTWHAFHKIPPVVADRTGAFTHSFLVASRHFALEEYRFAAAAEVSLPVKRSFRVVTVCSGTARLACDGAAQLLNKGETALIPACLSALRVSGETGTQFLLSSVPDLISEVVAPLSKKGVSQDAIVHLGGNPATSDLAVLV
jgi:mannose-6-phosphate isomerase